MRIKGISLPPSAQTHRRWGAINVRHRRKDETVLAFTEDLKAHGGAPENVTAACIDMSKAFIKGINTALPNAVTTFDPFIATGSKAMLGFRENGKNGNTSWKCPYFQVALDRLKTYQGLRLNF